ncbi:MAG: hypothetical protein HY300_09255 [Verrucomicrobia bacterium]|nr:hypothetical protein [Verrucomicrobiota bacterium]
MAASFPALPLAAHIGSPNIIFDGKAGAVPVRVVIQPPGVIPGIAQISVRTEGGVKRITALPVFWRTGRQGAPPPDTAKPVPGETNLYSAQLWLMTQGAYSVEVAVETDSGSGSVSIPVNAIATVRREMKPAMGFVLAAMGVFLFIAAVKLAGAALGEALLAPGAAVTRTARICSRAGMGLAFVVAVSAVGFGKGWWDRVDRDYRSNRLYQPLPVTADVRNERGADILRLNVDTSGRNARFWSPVIPDHGKLMHLFLLREPERDVFAHLHPMQRGQAIFEAVVPPLPAGEYAVIADVTHESGFAQTLTAKMKLGEPSTAAFLRTNAVERGTNSLNDPLCATPTRNVIAVNGTLAPDSDDSWHIGNPSTATITLTNAGAKSCRLDGGYTMVWDAPGTLAANRETSLRFRALAPDGSPAKLEPYIGMSGHAALRRSDGSVFAHLHPVGTISMASQEAFVQREKQNPQASADSVKSEPHMPGLVETVLFPYEFPRPGSYRLWVQVKVAGRPLTGVFDAEVR